MKASSFGWAMTIEEARSVQWPFREFKGQAMGDLLDSGRIVLKDLGFAFERAYDRQIREAARTLLLYALSSEKQDERIAELGPLNVIASGHRSFAERRQLELAIVEGAIAGSVMTILILLFIQVTFFPNTQNSLFTSRSSDIAGIAVILIISIGIIAIVTYSVNVLLDHIERQMRLHRKGQLGEERVLNAMYLALDGGWWLFRNLELPGQRAGDIDFVLVGSKGVWALEVKAFDGKYRNVGDQWERHWRGRWLPAFKNPGKQAKRHAATLAHALQTHHVKQWVNPGIIWANPESQLVQENPAVMVWELDQIGNALNTFQDARPISDEQVAKIVEIFKGLYKQPFLSGDASDN